MGGLLLPILAERGSAQAEQETQCYKTNEMVVKTSSKEKNQAQCPFLALSGKNKFVLTYAAFGLTGTLHAASLFFLKISILESRYPKLTIAYPVDS
jgi:hypothetical protein